MNPPCLGNTLQGSRKGWSRGRVRIGAPSLRQNWTWIPAGTMNCCQLPSGSRARKAASLAQGIPPAPAWREVWHGRGVYTVRGIGCPSEEYDGLSDGAWSDRARGRGDRGTQDVWHDDPGLAGLG